MNERVVNSTDAVVREQQLGVAHHRPQLTRQWNKCVKHCLEWDSSLPLTYPTLDSNLTYLIHGRDQREQPIVFDTVHVTASRMAT